MFGCRWILLGLLAALAITSSAYPQESNVGWFGRNPEIDYDDIVTEDEMSESDLREIAEEIAEEIQMENEDEDGFSARGKLGSALKTVGNGLKKGGKKVGGAIMSAGKQVVKVTGKGIKVAGKGLKKVGKASGKGLKKGLLTAGKAAGKGLKAAGKKAKVVATQKGKLIWGSLKEKMNGELAQAGKQLLKKVGQEVLEQGASLAIEAITPMIIEYVMDETQDRLCSCDGLKCSCCAAPPGFEKACLEINIRPVKKMMNAAITYNGKELTKLDITKEDGEASCTKLTGLARFIQACISPIGIGEFEGGFRGCLNIQLEPLSLERSMCVDFKGTRQNPSANFVSVAEIDAVEMEEADEEPEEEEYDEEAEDY